MAKLVIDSSSVGSILTIGYHSVPLQKQPNLADNLTIMNIRTQ